MWPFKRSKAVETALSGSQRRLEETKELQKKLEPKFEQLRREVSRNRFEEAVLAGFRKVES